MSSSANVFLCLALGCLSLFAGSWLFGDIAPAPAALVVMLIVGGIYICLDSTIPRRQRYWDDQGNEVEPFSVREWVTSGYKPPRERIVFEEPAVKPKPPVRFGNFGDRKYSQSPYRVRKG